MGDLHLGHPRNLPAILPHTIPGPDSRPRTEDAPHHEGPLDRPNSNQPHHPRQLRLGIPEDHSAAAEKAGCHFSHHLLPADLLLAETLLYLLSGHQGALQYAEEHHTVHHPLVHCHLRLLKCLLHH